MINRYAARIMTAVLALTIAVGPLQAQQQAPVRVPRSVLQQYVGEYEGNGNTLRIALSGDSLVREVSGQRVPLVPISETLFWVGPVFTAQFVVDQAGGATLIMASGTSEYRYPRKGSRVAPAPPIASVPVPRAVLEQYVGTYKYIAGQMSRTDLRIEIKRRGDTLIRDMGADEAVLTPTSETQFRVGNTALTTEFAIDQAGVTLILGSGFQQVLARRTNR